MKTNTSLAFWKNFLLFEAEDEELKFPEEPTAEKEIPEGWEVFQKFGNVIETGPGSEVAEVAQDQLFQLVNQAYGEVGGHMNVGSPESLSQYDYWIFNNPLKDPEMKIRAAIFASPTNNGSVKVSVFATDSSPTGKLFMLSNMKNILSRPDWWAEIPDYAASVFTRAGIPMVDSEEAVMMLLGRRVFGSNFEWHGEHPGKRKMPGQGWYSKSYAGAPSTRAIFGNVTAKKIQDIKDFISKPRY